jgi:thiamine pyrophosphokinase
MRGFVLGAAPLGKPDYVSGYLRPDDMVLCADGGLRHARALGLRPHALIGDADSGGRWPPPGVSVIRLPREKNQTDLQACLDYGLQNGCDEFLLLGCGGGPRLDHFLGNLGLLEYCAERDARAQIVDARHEIRLHTGGLMVIPDPDAFMYLSIIPLDVHVSGVTLRGLRFPLTDAELRRTETLGLSNEPLGTGALVEIAIARGRALVVRAVRRRA